MTVIAFRDGTVAADSLTTRDYRRIGRYTKIIRAPGGEVLGMAGSAGEVLHLRDWYLGGKRDKQPPSTDGVLMAFFRNRIEVYGEGSMSIMSRAPFYAFGIGGDVAAGAMAHGASAPEAVRAAIKLNVYCGGPVTVLTL